MEDWEEPYFTEEGKNLLLWLSVIAILLGCGWLAING